MKKIHYISIFLFCMTMSLSAKINFGTFDLNQNDEVLFSLSQNMPGTNSYSSLFYSKLVNGTGQNSPELLTCYPEQLELLDEGTVLQIRNRY